MSVKKEKRGQKESAKRKKKLNAYEKQKKAMQQIGNGEM